jgi:uncharacterized damage-inducible protein DinB
MLAELKTCLELLEGLREAAAACIEGLPAEALNWRPLEGTDENETNSLAATFAHLTGSQRYWVGQIVGGRDARRVREAEFRVTAEDAGELLRQLEATYALLREVLAGVTAEQLDEAVDTGRRTVTRRWAMLHALEHGALHVGHMQLTRQLWEGR